MSLLRRVLGWGLLAGWLAILGPGRVAAQGPTIGGDSPGAPGSTNSTLGAIPGSGGSLLGSIPGVGGGGQSQGAGAQYLGGRPGPTSSHAPTSISAPVSPSLNLNAPAIATQNITSPATAPVYGSLAIPDIADSEGPPDGMTLDAAIETMLRENLTLRGQYMEIPQAQADILTASLRSNPVFYADGQLVPYGQFSNARIDRAAKLSMT